MCCVKRRKRRLNVGNFSVFVTKLLTDPKYRDNNRTIGPEALRSANISQLRLLFYRLIFYTHFWTTPRSIQVIILGGGAGVPLSLWYIPIYNIQGQYPLTGNSIPWNQPPVVTQLLASSTYTAMTHRSISDTGSYDQNPMTSHPGSMCLSWEPPSANLWGGNKWRRYFGKHQ